MSDGLGLHFLWHLEQIGALVADPGDAARRVPSDAWVGLLDGARPVKIALIDNGAALDHPNLQESSRPCLHQPIEFAAHVQARFTATTQTPVFRASTACPRRWPGWASPMRPGFSTGR